MLSKVWWDDMEGLAQAFSSFFNNPGDVKLLQTGIAGAGTAGNIMQQVKANQYRDFVMSLLGNPAKLAALVSKIQQPLNRGLEQSVGNQVQGDLASRGLSQAPGIFAASESQALAPYEQQNQNTALNAIMQALGLPAGTFGAQTNLSPLFSSLFQGGKSPLLPAQTAPSPGLTPPDNSNVPPPDSGGANWGP
jgi:hypothetical protein